MKRILVAGLMLISTMLTGCQSSSTDQNIDDMTKRVAAKIIAEGQRPQTTPYRLNSIEIAAVKKRVKENLKDPNSAVFEIMLGSKIDSTDSIFVCGVVNAKNSFGGYAGRTPYYTLLRTGTNAHGQRVSYGSITTIGSTQTDLAVVVSMCRDHNINLTFG